MGKGGGGTQQVVNTTQLPQWVENAAQQNLAAAYEVAHNMPGPYSGQTVAEMNQGQLQTIADIGSSYGMAQPAYAYAQQMAAQAGQYQPQQVQAGQLSTADLAPYMNPFTESVLQSSLDTLNQQRLQNLNAASDAAIRARAFGGSRQAIQEGVVNAAAQQQAGNLAAQLYSQNFQQAQQAAQADIANQMAAQQLNQAAGLQQAGLGLQGAQALGNLAGAGQQAYLQGAGSALAAQTALQQQQQAQLDAAQQAYYAAQQFPLQQLQIPLQALGATPYGQINTQTGPGPTSNPLLTGLGAAASAASLAASIAAL